MHRIIPIEEDSLHSCRSIAHFLAKYTGHDPASLEKRRAVLKNLVWQLVRLDAGDRAAVMAESWYNMLPEDVRKAFPQDAVGIVDIYRRIGTTERRRDVGIVTIKRPELTAVLLALGDKAPETPDVTIGPYPYWFGDVRRDDGSLLSVVVTFVGRSRNVPCAIAVEHLMSNYEVGMLMLIGMAAGPREKVKQGDVACAQRVYDYEHVRLELSKVSDDAEKQTVKLPRPEYIPVHQDIGVALELYNPRRMQTQFSQLKKRVRKDKLPEEILGRGFKPVFHSGTIAAGEKLIADGTLNKMCRIVDQQIRAGDQEDSGFAAAAVLRGAKWCIFRGISDYGDVTKDDKEDEDPWQLAASLVAAAAGLTFIQSVARVQA